jgi:hypothetical protein
MIKLADECKEDSDFFQGRSVLNGSIVLHEVGTDYSLTRDAKSFMLRAENEKPEPPSSGSNAMNGTYVPPIIADSHLRASGKNIVCHEAVMDPDSGYIRIPRSLLRDPRFTNAPISFRIIYLKILELAAYRDTEHNDRGTILKIKAGQVSISLRKLAEACGPEITKKKVECALAYFKKVNLGGHQRGHEKNVISITHEDTYDLITNVQGTAKGTVRGQRGDTKEEYKESKDIRKKKSAASVSADRSRSTAGPAISFSFELKKWENIGVADVDGWSLAYPAVNVDVQLKAMREWLLANPTKRKSNYRAFIVRWLTKEQDRPDKLPNFQNPVEKKRDIISLMHRLSGRYVYELKFGVIEIHSATGHVAGKFDKEDLDGFEKWLNERNL